GYRVNQPLRNKVIFAPHDLARDAPFARLDLILCRGVLIDFEHALQDRVVRGFQRALRPWGYLVVDAAETVTGNQLQRVDATCPIYRNPGAHPVAVNPESGRPLAPGEDREHNQPAPDAPDPRAPGAASEAEASTGERLRAALDELAAARHELDAI